MLQYVAASLYFCEKENVYRVVQKHDSCGEVELYAL